MELTKREIELVLGKMKKDPRLNNAVWRAYHENELLYMNTGIYEFYEPTTLEDYLEWNGKGIMLVKEFLEKGDIKMRKIVTKNTVKNDRAENGDVIEVVKFIKREHYYSFVGDVYSYTEFTQEDIEDYVTGFISDVIDITHFENNPDQSYNDLVEQLSEEYNFVNEVLTDVIAYDVLDNGIGVWQMTGGGQITTDHDIFNRVWNEYHLNKDLTATEHKTINDAMDLVGRKVEQKTVLGDLI